MSAVRPGTALRGSYDAWLDIAQMVNAGAVKPVEVAELVRTIVGEDERVGRLLNLVTPDRPG